MISSNENGPGVENNKLSNHHVITDDIMAPFDQEESEMILVDPDLDEDDSNMILDPDLDDSDSAAAIFQLPSVSEEEDIESGKAIESVTTPILQMTDEIDENNSRPSLEESC